MFKFIKKIIAFTVIFCSLFTSNIYAMTGKEKCDNYIKEVNGNTLIFKDHALQVKDNDKLLEFVEKYIKEYLNREFDINHYDINISEGISYEDSIEYRLKDIRLSYKLGDFVAEDVYFIVKVCDDELKTIKQFGKANCNLILKVLDDIDDKKMKKTAYEDAVKKYENYKGEYAYKIVGQTIEKTVNIGDKKAYYSVITSYKSKDGGSRCELTHYDINAMFINLSEVAGCYYEGEILHIIPLEGKENITYSIAEQAVGDSKVVFEAPKKYSYKKLNDGILILKDYENEMNLIYISIDVKRNGLYVVSDEEWTEERKEFLKKITEIDNVWFEYYDSVVDENVMKFVFEKFIISAVMGIKVIF